MTAFVVLFAVVLFIGAFAWFLFLDEQRMQREAQADAQHQWQVAKQRRGR